MKKIMVMIDSFKGTLSSKEANDLTCEFLNKKGHFTQNYPISDGGEGFLDVYSVLLKKPFSQTQVHDALFRIHTSNYIYNKENKTAYVELAQNCGIKELKKEELSVFKASSYGLGEQIKYIVNHHDVEKIIVGIGGSASSDAGCGMLEALEAKFYDKNHDLLNHMNNEKLKNVESVDLDDLFSLLKNVKIEVLTDVSNPLLGEKGAVRVFSPQKGATADDLVSLEENIAHFHDVLKNSNLLKDKPSEGDGAAGGVGFAFNKVIDAKLKSGTDVILREINFKEKVKEFDIIITGEGKFDEQTLGGKIISGIMAYNPKRLIVLAGSATISSSSCEVYKIVPDVCTLDEALKNPKENFVKMLNNLNI